jgi:hypothetical protein
MDSLRRLIQVMLVAVATGLSAPALAGSCFEDVGCPADHNIPIWQLKKMSCDGLWTVRNSIFRDNGYCFKTKRALAIWDNNGCQYWNSGDVPLNNFESTNVSRISSVEKQMGCK